MPTTSSRRHKNDTEIVSRTASGRRHVSQPAARYSSYREETQGYEDLARPSIGRGYSQCHDGRLESKRCGGGRYKPRIQSFDLTLRTELDESVTGGFGLQAAAAHLGGTR
jgi:hypothetical protein